MERLEKKDIYKTSRILYVIEAALEYFIALGVGGAYLARLALEIGLSPLLVAIIEAFVSLGCGFQIIAVFLKNKTPVKTWVTILHIISQVFFALIWFVPFFRLSKTAKAVLFVSFVLIAQILHNVVNSPKINWFMSLVDDKKRGQFTAIKEIVSLISGMLFSLAYSKIIDYFEVAGKKEVTFALCGGLLLLIMLGHTLTLIFSKEKKTERKNEQIGQSLKLMIADKRLILVVLVPVLWNIINYSTLPFYNIYQNTDLGFSAMYIGILSVVYSIVRASLSTPFGKYADKRSFSALMSLCLIIAGASYLINVFVMPSNGHFLYLIAYSLNGAAMAGINSCTINQIYDIVDVDHRMGALAMKNTFAGIVGFVTTLICAPIVELINGAQLRLFGVRIYAPQIMSLFALFMVIILFLYNKKVVSKLKKSTL